MTDDNAPTRDNPILAKFRAALNEMYGERIERVLLYGSRARGDASGDSDYDIAVFLKDLSDRWAEADKIAVATTDILRDTGAVIHAMPYPAGAYRDRTPLMHEIRREGLDL
jgi:predicted nucleotidyltransferase